MSWLTDPLIAIVVFLTRNPGVPLVLAGVTPIALAAYASIRHITPGPFSRRKRHILTFLILGTLFGVLANFWIGHFIANALISLGGEDGYATASGYHRTNDIYNNHDVLARDVLIHTADGRVVRSSTRTDSFDIYPYRTSVSSDDQGRFAVRYLRHLPGTFIFVAG